MNKNTRLFLAIDLPTTVTTTLSSLSEQLKRANIQGLRPVQSENFHLTLKFLGVVPICQIPPIEKEISRVVTECNPFTLFFGEIGTSPNRATPKVIWAKISGELKPLHVLHRRIEDVGKELGFAKERRKFRPHLTLARLKEGGSKTDRRKITELLNTLNIQSHILFPITTVNFVESTLHSRGALHKNIATMRLGIGPAHPKNK